MTNICEVYLRQLVMDGEFIAGLHRMFEGITRHNLYEGIALIKADTPRGNFLRVKPTRGTFREHWLSEISSRDSFDTWQAKGQNHRVGLPGERYTNTERACPASTFHLDRGRIGTRHATLSSRFSFHSIKGRKNSSSEQDGCCYVNKQELKQYSLR
jgi:hypothetical protein